MPHLIPRARMAVTATQTALTPQAAAKRTQRRCHRPPLTCPPCLDLIPHLMLRRRRPLALARPPCLDLIPHWMPRRRRLLALLARPPCPDRIPRLWTRISSHPQSHPRPPVTLKKNA